jgi:hypothetical protein
MAKRICLVLIATLGLGACHLAPPLDVPEVPIAAQFHTQGPSARRTTKRVATVGGTSTRTRNWMGWSSSCCKTTRT